MAWEHQKEFNAVTELADVYPQLLDVFGSKMAEAIELLNENGYSNKISLVAYENESTLYQLSSLGYTLVLKAALAPNWEQYQYSTLRIGVIVYDKLRNEYGDEVFSYHMDQDGIAGRAPDNHEFGDSATIQFLCKVIKESIN